MCSRLAEQLRMCQPAGAQGWGCTGDCSKKDGHRFVMEKCDFDCFCALTTYMDNKNKETV